MVEPYCDECHKGFRTVNGYSQHVLDKHDKYLCCTCTRNRKFRSAQALEAHYKGSAEHPSCTRCWKGFLDEDTYERHLKIDHPQIDCMVCGGVAVFVDSLEQHYLNLRNHPTCKECNRGFKDDVLYGEHVRSVHPELCCQLCERSFHSQDALHTHYRLSPKHEKCIDCDVGFKDIESYTTHMASSHSDLSSSSNEVEQPADDWSQSEQPSPTKSRAPEIKEEPVVCQSSSPPPEDVLESVPSTPETTEHNDDDTTSLSRSDIYHGGKLDWMAAYGEFLG